MRPEALSRFALALWLGAALAGAAGADPLDSSEAERLLLEPELRGDPERAEEAEALLAIERRRKLAGLSASFVEVGLHASVQPSPVRLLKSARELGRGVIHWSERSEVEDEALLLLGPAARSGALDPEGQALYARLQERDAHARVEALLDDARRALSSRDLRRARRAALRALEIEPGSSRADVLLDEIEARAWLDAPGDAAEAAEDDVGGPFEPWEVRLSAALLVDDYARARAAGDDGGRDAELARAAARYLEGERAAALADFARLAEGEDATAAHARRWLADPDLNPESTLEREARSFRARRALGWMGGEELAAAAVPATEEALELSRDGYRAWQGSYKAWRDTLRLVNLVVEAPARAWRAWQPDGSDLHRAAERYLEVTPDGARAAEAAGWLEELHAQELETARNAPFRDGWLELPRSRTLFGRLAATRVMISRDALEAHAPELLAELGVGDSPAVLFSLELPGETVHGTLYELAPERALVLLAQMAAGLEANGLEPRGESASEVLESLRRLDARVREGRTLRAEPWNPALAGVGAVGDTLVDGGRVRTAAGVAVERDEETLSAEREIGGSGAFCPRETPCVDLRREWTRGVYARTDADGDLSVGAAAGFASAQFAIEVGTDGPRASLVLPLARWLGMGRFFPVEARVGVGLDGVSAGPNVDDDAPRAADPPPSL